MDRLTQTEQRVGDEQLQLLFAGLPSSLLATLVLLTLTVTAAHFFLWLAHRRHADRENIAWFLQSKVS